MKSLVPVWFLIVCCLAMFSLSFFVFKKAGQPDIPFQLADARAIHTIDSLERTGMHQQEEIERLKEQSVKDSVAVAKAEEAVQIIDAQAQASIQRAQISFNLIKKKHEDLDRINTLSGDSLRRAVAEFQYP